MEAKWPTVDDPTQAATRLIQIKVVRPLTRVRTSRLSGAGVSWTTLAGDETDACRDAAGMGKSMTWQGLHPVVELSRDVCEKGLSLGNKAMQAVAARLKRGPQLPKDDMLINSVSTS